MRIYYIIKYKFCIYLYYFTSSNHFSNISLEFLTSEPTIDNPFLTSELSHIFFMSFTLLPNPLPSCVQIGFITFPEKSYSSKNVN